MENAFNKRKQQMYMKKSVINKMQIEIPQEK